MDIALCIGVHNRLKLLKAPLGVYKENAALLELLGHLKALGNVRGVVAGDKVGLIDIVGALYGAVSEAEVRNRNASGLLGVILEICLNIFVGVVTYNLYGVRIGSDCAVAAKTPEHARNSAFGRRVGNFFLLKGEISHVVDYADCEASLRLVLLELLIDCKDAGRRRILGGKTVSATDNLNVAAAGFTKRGNNIHEERLAQSAGLLGAV